MLLKSFSFYFGDCNFLTIFLFFPHSLLTLRHTFLQSIASFSLIVNACICPYIYINKYNQLSPYAMTRIYVSKAATWHRTAGWHALSLGRTAFPLPALPSCPYSFVGLRPHGFFWSTLACLLVSSLFWIVWSCW